MQQKKWENNRPYMTAHLLAVSERQYCVANQQFTQYMQLEFIQHTCRLIKVEVDSFGLTSKQFKVICMASLQLIHYQWQDFVHVMLFKFLPQYYPVDKLTNVDHYHSYLKIGNF